MVSTAWAQWAPPAAAIRTSDMTDKQRREAAVEGKGGVDTAHAASPHKGCLCSAQEMLGIREGKTSRRLVGRVLYG